jgi:catechol 2,3-dioxygenase-like lactoylglutathione lyase family enzyme
MTAIHSIDHFALAVPDLHQARTFFSTFGLDIQEEAAGGGGLNVFAADGHRWARLVAGEKKHLKYLSFNAYQEDIYRLRSQVVAAGALDVSAITQGDEAAFWFRDPDGNQIQVRVGPKTTLNEKPTRVSGSTPADKRGACTRSQVASVRPSRLSHVLLFTPDVLASVAFYERALGLRLSDKSRDIIAFMHAPHGCDHHLVAFAISTARGWHHSSWDVDDVNSVGAGAAQMAAAGYAKGWGTGRHVLGSNYFHYVEDPWGSFCEYSADIDYVSADKPWPAGDFPPEDSLYLWGPNVPDNFITNTEA